MRIGLAVGYQFQQQFYQSIIGERDWAQLLEGRERVGVGSKWVGYGIFYQIWRWWHIIIFMFDSQNRNDSSQLSGQSPLIIINMALHAKYSKHPPYNKNIRKFLEYFARKYKNQSLFSKEKNYLWDQWEYLTQCHDLTQIMTSIQGIILNNVTERGNHLIRLDGEIRLYHVGSKKKILALKTIDLKNKPRIKPLLPKTELQRVQLLHDMTKTQSENSEVKEFRELKIYLSRMVQKFNQSENQLDFPQNQRQKFDKRNQKSEKHCKKSLQKQKNSLPKRDKQPLLFKSHKVDLKPCQVDSYGLIKKEKKINQTKRKKPLKLNLKNQSTKKYLQPLKPRSDHENKFKNSQTPNSHSQNKHWNSKKNHSHRKLHRSKENIQNIINSMKPKSKERKNLLLSQKFNRTKVKSLSPIEVHQPYLTQKNCL